MRPVFLILMGLVLLLVAWRLVRHRSDWPTRLLIAGAFLLAFGYAVLLPLYDVEELVPMQHLGWHRDADPGTSAGWHLVKSVTMNGGWFLFGLGLSLYAGSVRGGRAIKTFSAES
jgi:hypothetical protein